MLKVELLEEKKIINDMYTSIITEVFPEGNCENGDVNYFRKAIVTEKARLLYLYLYIRIYDRRYYFDIELRKIYTYL